jgi:hypothetical protein
MDRASGVGVVALAVVLCAGTALASHEAASFYVTTFNARGAAHYGYSGASKRLTDPLVHIKPATPLLDADGARLFSGTSTKQFLVVEGGERFTYAIQKRTSLPGKRGHADPLVYIWGGAGDAAFQLEDEHTGKVERSAIPFSGFVYRSDIVSEAPSVPRHVDHWNGFGGHADWLRDLEVSYLDKKRYGPEAEATIAPRRVEGEYAPKHELSDYGYAHGELREFAYLLWNVPDNSPDGGVTGLILPRGRKVRATTVTCQTRFELANHEKKPTRAEENADRTFVLCIVELLDRSQVGAWICRADLEGEHHPKKEAASATARSDLDPWIEKLCAKTFKDVTGRDLPAEARRDETSLFRAFESAHLVRTDGTPPAGAFVFFADRIVVSNGNGTALGRSAAGKTETAIALGSLGTARGWVASK